MPHFELALRDEPEGAAKAIRSLAHPAAKYPRKSKLETEFGCFRRHRNRMRYAELEAEGLMIGSGIVDAACKTLVTKRLKQSGVRWTSTGGRPYSPSEAGTRANGSTTPAH